MSSKITKVTVAILTFNGEQYLEEVFASLLEQKTSFNFDVLIIDSGSTDKTLVIVGKNSKLLNKKGIKCRLLEIKNSDFGHGKTRNLAIKQSNSEFIAFLTQDATPATDNWLASLVSAYDLDNKVVATFGPHLARENCNPVIKRDMENHFKNFGTNDIPAIQSIKKGEEIEGVAGFFSDVNSSICKSFWIKHPYKEVSYAEDQIMGRDILKSGYKKAYCPKASVFHSHTYPTSEYLGRYFDEYRGLKESIGFVDKNVTFFRIIPNALKNFKDDARYIKTQNYSDRKFLKYLWQAFIMSIFRQTAAYMGARYEKMPKCIINRISLELSRKRRAYV